MIMFYRFDRDTKDTLPRIWASAWEPFSFQPTIEGFFPVANPLERP